MKSNLSNKRKLLFISTRPPFPLLSGEKNKTFNIIKKLSESFDITYCSFCEGNESEVRKLLEPYCKKVELVEFNKLTAMWNTFKYFLKGKPLQIGYFFDQKLQDIVTSEISTHEFVFCNIVRSAEYVLEKFHPNCFMDFSDSISLHYEKAKAKTHSIAWRLIYSIESERLLNYEKRAIHRMKQSFHFNPDEAKIYNSNKLKWVPHGVKDELLAEQTHVEIKPKVISFFGKMDYRPNVDAVIWFVNNVMASLDGFILQIVGAYPSAEVLKLQSERVKIMGFVSDPYRVLRESLCVVAPMISGAGIQNKVLEAMAIGATNVVSDLAAKPFIGLNGDELYVANTKEDWVKVIKSLDVKSELYIDTRERASNYIRRNYSWDKYIEIVLNEMNK